MPLYHPVPSVYLLQLKSLSFVLIAVGVLAVRQTQGPDTDDAVYVVSYPGMRYLAAARQQPRHRVLQRMEEKTPKKHNTEITALGEIPKQILTLYY